MFVRIDRDLVINMNQITSYNIIEEPDAYKLLIYKNDKTPIHTVYYMKQHSHEVELLLSFINVMNDYVINPDRTIYTPINNEEHIEETIENIEEETANE